MSIMSDINPFGSTMLEGDRFAQPEAWRGELTGNPQVDSDIPESGAITFRPWLPSWSPTEHKSLRPELHRIGQAIEASRTILDLVDDWDGEGSERYAEATWERAVDFLEKSAERLWDMHGLVLDPPKILAGPEGSIDLHWNHPAYEMLINFPSDESSPAAFYADDRGDLTIKGKMNPSGQNPALLVWFAEAR